MTVSQIEQLSKTKDFLKNKVSDCEMREAEFIDQIGKYTDLVKHLELEKNNVDFLIGSAFAAFFGSVFFFLWNHFFSFV